MTGAAGLSRPRCVIVTRRTPVELLLERHGTLGQARFYLKSRGESIAPAERIHESVQGALRAVDEGIPADQRRTRVDRDALDRFVFEDADIVVVVGQDGLVPNAAKYLHGQTVVGVNPDPEQYDGVLCRHAPAAFGRILGWLSHPHGKEFAIQTRVMAGVEREDGQRLLALNEVFLGHRTHQSARYRLALGEKSERQSSSGIIVSTGTGSTGWARSVAEQRAMRELLPEPTEAVLAWFVREPFPSVSTGTQLDFGLLDEDGELTVVSEMPDGGTIFADGIESDRLEFGAGQVAKVRVSPERLRLVIEHVVPRKTEPSAKEGAPSPKKQGASRRR